MGFARIWAFGPANIPIVWFPKLVMALLTFADLILHSGRLFDKDGNLNNWWSFVSGIGFQERAVCLSKQYSQFEVYGQKVGLRMNSILRNSAHVPIMLRRETSVGFSTLENCVRVT